MSDWEQSSPDEFNDKLYFGWLEDYLENEVPLCQYFFPDSLIESDESEEDCTS